MTGAGNIGCCLSTQILKEFIIIPCNFKHNKMYRKDYKLLNYQKIINKQLSMTYRMQGIGCLLTVAILSLSCILSSAEFCQSSDDEFLVTFHPHMDAFWLNTDTQLMDINFVPAGFLFNMNQRNSKVIFNSMLTALTGSKERKYFVTESVFFKNWYDYISAESRYKVKQLLKNGQLQIANGAWVQNDQAVCYYDDILDQYTVGMNFLYEELDYQIKIAWATDSFGHSHSQAALEHLLGIEFQGIERVDDRYIRKHNDGPLLQFYWQPFSDSNNITYGGVLNHVRHFLHEVNNLRATNPFLIKKDFTEIMATMKADYHKNKLFRFLGNDFQQFISDQFVNLQKSFSELNKQANKQTCPVFKYGNPADYLQLITKYYEQNKLPTRKHDFIPNWDQDRYWSGYFTTDPLLKKTCKDYSRIVNFYRKSLLFTNTYQQYFPKLAPIEELLAVMQHHDGITATSKIYIQDEFKNRMKKKTQEIISNIQQIHSAKGTVICNFYQESNECQIPQMFSDGSLKNLQIITHGASKKQKIQLTLPKNTFYDIVQVQQDILCETQFKCVIVFQAALHPGVNKYTFAKKTKQQLASSIFNAAAVVGTSHNGRDYTLSIDNAKNSIKYEYGDGEYFNISFHTSPNRGYMRQTKWWDKYGRETTKTENIASGMYIMANNGNLENIGAPLNDLKVAEGKIFKRFYTQSTISNLKVTIKNDEPNMIDVWHNFKPATRALVDYFMKISSSVKSSTLYHDSNGFLVAKRQYNHRPDYQFKVIEEDKINSNTYPVCSFAYLIANNKKFLFFTDRAQGVATYDNDLLINFDRLALDDGKGVGQTYFSTVNNTFRYKFAVVSSSDDIERVWQKQYDQALLGFLSKEQKDLKYRVNPQQQISHIPGNGKLMNLKYSIFYLNKNEIVLRLQNLAQFTNLQVLKHEGSQGNFIWNIEQIGLKLKFSDIMQSYANGIVIQKDMKWRKYWGKDDEKTINLANTGKNDGAKIYLKPLQIRSFRINLKSKIQPKTVQIPSKNPVLQTLNNVKHIKGLRKRCF